MSGFVFIRRDSIGLLRLQAPPVNALTIPLLEDLQRTLHRANNDPRIQGLLLTGDSRHFSAGADIQLFREITGQEDAIRLCRAFQEAFLAVENSAKPIAAALTGRVLGGALELAMACHFRVAADDTRFMMPEVTLGINPGAGGTQRLPRLIGPGPALKMLLTAQSLRADQAHHAGLIDEVWPSRELLDKTIHLLQSGKPPQKTRDRLDRVRDADANQIALAEARKLLADVRPELIAPSRILEAVRIGLAESFQAGLRAEQQAFAACIQTPATRNKIHLFFATRQTARPPVQAAASAGRDPVRSVGVVGMGSMGTGIAHALIQSGLSVVALDQTEAALHSACRRIRRSLENRVAAGRGSPRQIENQLCRIRTTTNWHDLADADLVIEAVFEEVPTKQAVLAAIEKAVRPDAIIASNTSTISLDRLSQGLQRPDRLVGLHFFNPAHRMPLVEVIQPAAVSPPVLAAALEFAKSIRKTPLLVKNREGFVVSRLFVPYVKEAFWLLEEGAAAQALDHAMVRFGFPMGPFSLIDMTGIDILAMTDRVLTGAFPRHGPLPPVAAQLVADGCLGQKTGAGVYRYESGNRDPQESNATRRIVERVQQEKGITARPVSDGEIAERLLLRMANEAFWILDEGVAQRESDIDAATALGLGFPDFRGGLVRYARECGLDQVRNRLEHLRKKFGDRFLACEPLRNRKGNG